MAAQKRTLFHYTTAANLQAIVTSGVLRPSLRTRNPKDIRHGEGQYLSDIVPGTRTPGQLAYVFLNDPRGWRRFTHYVEIDVTNLDVVEMRPGVLVIPSTRELSLTDRIVGRGEVPRRRAR